MCEVKTFKIEQKLTGIEELYSYLTKNIKDISASTGIQIQKPLKFRPFCLTGKEKITERNILFFASKSEFPESLGELIILAGALESDIVVVFVEKLSKAKLEAMNWLSKISNADTDIIVCEITF